MRTIEQGGYRLGDLAYIKGHKDLDGRPGKIIDFPNSSMVSLLVKQKNGTFISPVLLLKDIEEAE